MRTKLYFAYGSNLNIEQMAQRCPTATPICELQLKNWKLVFRGVADVIPQHGASVWGGLWRITEADEEKLDRYEGVRSGLYRKVYLPCKPFMGDTCMLMYVMNSYGIFPPSQGYLDGIIDGYKHFRLGDNAHRLLDEALTEAWDDKRPSRRERERSARYGWPKLARPKHCDNCGFCRRKEKKKEKINETRLLPFVFSDGRKAEPARCRFEWRGGRCAREHGHPNGHRIQ